jgi:hypothetical protein
MRPNAHHTLVVLAIAFATAAISVPGALGGVRPNDRAGVHGIGAASATGTAAGPDWFERAVARHNQAQNLVEAARYRAIGPDWFERAVARHNATRPSAAVHSTAVQGYRFITDTLARGGHSTAVQGYRFITDTLAPGGGTIVSAPAAGGFDWADAGIGAAIAAGLLLVLLGSGRVLQQHRRRVVAV